MEGSPRLRRLLAALIDGEWHSTRDLSLRAECYSLGASMQELKDARNGCDIERRFVDGRHEYRLIYCPERLRIFLKEAEA